MSFGNSLPSPVSSHNLLHGPDTRRRQCSSRLLEMGDNVLDDSGEIRVHPHGIIAMNTGDKVRAFSDVGSVLVAPFHPFVVGVSRLHRWPANRQRVHGSFAACVSDPCSRWLAMSISQPPLVHATGRGGGACPETPLGRAPCDALPSVRSRVPRAAKVSERGDGGRASSRRRPGRRGPWRRWRARERPGCSGPQKSRSSNSTVPKKRRLPHSSY